MKMRVPVLSLVYIYTVTHSYTQIISTENSNLLNLSTRIQPKYIDTLTYSYTQIILTEISKTYLTYLEVCTDYIS